MISITAIKLMLITYWMDENVHIHRSRSLEEIVDTIGKNNVDDKVKYDTIPLEQVRVRKHLLYLETLHNFMVSFKRQYQNF